MSATVRWRSLGLICSRTADDERRLATAAKNQIANKGLGSMDVTKINFLPPSGRRAMQRVSTARHDDVLLPWPPRSFESPDLVPLFVGRRELRLR